TRSTENFLTYLREAALVKGLKSPLLPKAIAARRGRFVHTWREWEQALNPSANLPIRPTICVSGWPDGGKLQNALRDLYQIRGLLIHHWGLAALVGGQPFFVETTKDVGHPQRTVCGQARLQKPLCWPGPVPITWWHQAQYSIQQTAEVLERGRAICPADP